MSESLDLANPMSEEDQRELLEDMGFLESE